MGANLLTAILGAELIEQIQQGQVMQEVASWL